MLKQFKDQKLQSTILDLRNNPGGLLTSAVEVSEQFLPGGKLVVYTKGRESKKDEWIAKGKDQMDDSHSRLVRLTSFWQQGLRPDSQLTQEHAPLPTF